MRTFSELLRLYMQREERTAGQLSKLTDISKQTIASWAEGRVKRPQQRGQLIKITRALQLTDVETNTLLRAAKHSPLTDPSPPFGAGGADGERGDFRPAVQHPKPFQAVAQSPFFVGRQAVLDRLLHMLQQENDHSIYCIQGMAGVGKTAVAIEVAYRLRHHFRDGVLWAQPRDECAMQILLGFAAAYGHDATDYSSLKSRSRFVRTLLAEKNVLLILDGVTDSVMVRDLLPPTGRSAVLLTSRHRNLTLVPKENCIELAPFGPDGAEAQQLLNCVLGETAARHDPQWAEIATLLGQLPLALLLAATRLRAEPLQTADKLLRRLLQEKRRLRELKRDAQSVQAVLTVGYEALTAAQRRLFNALGAFGRGDVDVAAVAHVADVSLEDAEDGLSDLYIQSLVDVSHEGRFDCHPLIRDFARQQTSDVAHGRMVEYFLTYAAQHSDRYASLQREHPHLHDALEAARIGNVAEHARFTLQLAPYLIAQGLYPFAEQQLLAALTVAEQTNDAQVRGYALYHLAQIVERRGYSQRARHLYERLRNGQSDLQTEPQLLIRLYQQLAWLAFQLGDMDGMRQTLAQAAQFLGDDLARLTRHQMMAQQVNHAQAMTAATIRLHEGRGVLRQRQALHEPPAAQAELWGEAEQALQNGLVLAREAGFADGTGGGLLIALGWLTLYRRQYAQATAHFTEGLALAEQIAHVERVVHAQLGLGMAGLLQSESAQPSLLQAAAKRAQTIDNHLLQVATSLAWGWQLTQQGEIERAAEQWLRCQTLLTGTPWPSLSSLLDIGLKMLEGAEPSAEMVELTPLIWEILHAITVTSQPDTIWYKLS